MPKHAQITEHAISLMWSAPSSKWEAASRVGQVYCWSFTTLEKGRTAYVVRRGRSVESLLFVRMMTRRLAICSTMPTTSHKPVGKHAHRRQQDTG
jgi:hypothetical protein